MFDFFSICQEGNQAKPFERFIFMFILHYFGGLQHWTVVMQNNKCAYLFYVKKKKMTVSLMRLSL